MKNRLIFWLCFFLNLTAFAQKQNVYYLKNDGQKVPTRDSADLIRIISEPDSGTKLFNIREYYVNGKIKLTGKTSATDRSFLEGQCVEFYSSGKRKRVANYRGNQLDGDTYEYFPNGKLYAIKQYEQMKSDDFIKVNTCNDSTGKNLVVDGNGYYIGYSENFKSIFEQGNIKNGVRDSLWTGKTSVRATPSNSVSFREKYENGKLIAGTSTDSLNKTYTYSQRETNPGFVGGEDAFGRFLRNNLRYPKAAKENNIQGRVFVQFIVEKDGSLSHIKAIRDPGNGLGDEGVRVIALSPNWAPGLYFGYPVRVQYTVPINFSLAY